MKQIITVLESNKVSVTAGIMPLDSKHYNEGLDDKDKFSQIPLTLTFDVSGVVGKNEIVETSPMLERSMDGYVIDARGPLKKEADEGMFGKNNQQKYDRMVELIPEWEKRIFELPIRKGRQPSETATQKKQARDLVQQARDLMDMHERFFDKIKPSTLNAIIRKALETPESEWIAKRGFVEAELINVSKKA